MRLREGARIAVIGAGPSGLAAAKHALEAGFDVAVFEAGDALGGQWRTTAAYSGVWPGHAHQHEPRDDRVLRLPRARRSTRCTRRPSRSSTTCERYAAPSASSTAIRFGTRVEDVRPGVDRGRRAVRRASSSPPGASARRGCRPVVSGFRGELLHAFDYPGAEPFRDRARAGLRQRRQRRSRSPPTSRRTHEVVSAFRKPRYVIQKVVDGVSSDWQWYTLVGALERRGLPPAELGRRQRERIAARGRQPRRLRRARARTRTCSSPGVSLCQDYLRAGAGRRASSVARRSRRSRGRR